MINLAILAPVKESYSETFIQVHRQLRFNIKFYFDGLIPKRLEPIGILPYNMEHGFYQNLTLPELKLRESFIKEQIDCVLTEFGITAAESLNVVQSLNIPLVVHFHGYDASKEISARYYEKYLQVFNYASFIIVVSNKMYEDLLRIGCPKEKMVISYYGPNENYLNLRPKSKQKQFIAAERFIDKKAFALTITAFRNVTALYPEAVLIFTGNGPFFDKCKDLVREWGLTSNIRLIGPVSQKSLQKLFSESIAFIQHSVVSEHCNSAETPIVVMEASAAALPVISTKHGGVPDVILDGITGLLVDYFDVDGMSRAMIKILESPEFAKRLGNAGRSRIKTDFTVSKHLKSLETLIMKAHSSPAIGSKSIPILDNQKIAPFHFFGHEESSKGVRISVVMPCYNAEKFIYQAIQSIIDQSFNNFELLIIDDGSTDNTFLEVRKFNDVRIKYYAFKENRGNYFARNQGMKYAKGKYIAMFDADDIAKPNCLSNQYEYLESHKRVGCIGGLSELIDANNNKIGFIKRPFRYSNIKVCLLKDNFLTQSTMMIRRHLVVKHNLKYNEGFKYAGDYDFISKIIKLFPVVNLNQTLIQYRVHSSQISTFAKVDQINYANEVRRSQLINFNTGFSDDELDLHIKLMNTGSITKEELPAAAEWFNKLLEANEKHKFYSSALLFPFFRKILHAEILRLK